MRVTQDDHALARARSLALLLACREAASGQRKTREPQGPALVESENETSAPALQKPHVCAPSCKHRSVNIAGDRRKYRIKAAPIAENDPIEFA